MAQDIYFGWRILGEDAARALDDAHRASPDDDPGDNDGDGPVGVPAG